MIIPLRTDRDPRRRPIVVEAMIILNILVYLTGMIGNAAGWFDTEQFLDWGHFNPRDFELRQLFASLFMHDPYGIGHLAFNMLFLWVFGGPVEDRLGHAGFLGFYLMAGAVANIAHGMISSAPVIGASGAIAGVTGAFLALFPRSNIIVFYLFTMSVIHISSLWLIGLYFTIDILRQAGDLLGTGSSNVAYMAHIAGYVYGFAVAFVLLGTRVIKREEYDVFFLFTQARRRAAFRAANRRTATGAWESASADTGERLKRQRAAATASSSDDEALIAQRAEINRLASAGDVAAAAARYRQLLHSHPDAVFAEQRQLDLANRLFAEGDHAHAAAAYELLLDRWPRSRSADEVRLLLALIYTRHLRPRKTEAARALLSELRPRLDSSQADLADQLLAELGT